MDQLSKARDRYKSYADAKRTDPVYKVGDMVLLSTVNLNKHQMRRKLYPKFAGPFEILEAVNEVAYKLALPTTMPSHDVFLCSGVPISLLILPSRVLHLFQRLYQ